nr:hypothetical protein [Kibdelosporangium sp. MJ126-NF4]CTQ89650.1 hypothetical protein [Kibdelosporangium sp. MJ126-NF4]
MSAGKFPTVAKSTREDYPGTSTMTGTRTVLTMRLTRPPRDEYRASIVLTVPRSQDLGNPHQHTEARVPKCACRGQSSGRAVNSM